MFVFRADSCLQVVGMVIVVVVGAEEGRPPWLGEKPYWQRLSSSSTNTAQESYLRRQMKGLRRD